MSSAEAVAAVLWAGATVYAIFGGADFGAGLWRLLLADSRPDAERIRARIDHSIGPVWEANHVWLIFALVVLWTGFPTAFAALMETLYLPLALAGVGIVLRGSAFAFAGAFEGTLRGRLGILFGISSVLTPFFMGTVVGAIADGAVVAGEPQGPFEAWLSPLPLLIGALFVVSGAYIAAVFLVDDARRAGEPELVAYFRRQALVAAVVAGALAAAGLLVLRSDARFLYDGLTSEGLPLLIASLIAGGGALAAIWRGASRLARPLATAAVVAVIWGWGVAQHPYLLPETLTIDVAAGAPSTLTALLWFAVAALVIVGPSLLLLFRLAQRRVLE